MLAAAGPMVCLTSCMPYACHKENPLQHCSIKLWLVKLRYDADTVNSQLTGVSAWADGRVVSVAHVQSTVVMPGAAAAGCSGD